MSMLEVKDLQVYYGVIQALKGISFEVEQGDVVALIGANGAGKTTTLHTITGLLPSKAGNITFEGTDITHVPGYKLVSMGIARGAPCVRFPDGSSEPENGCVYEK